MSEKSKRKRKRMGGDMCRKNVHGGGGFFAAVVITSDKRVEVEWDGGMIEKRGSRKMSFGTCGLHAIASNEFG